MIIAPQRRQGRKERIEMREFKAKCQMTCFVFVVVIGVMMGAVTDSRGDQQTDMVFGWFEFSFPDYLSPSGSTTMQTEDGMIYRYYADTVSYLVIYQKGVYYLDALMTVYPLGAFEDWLDAAENDVAYHFFSQFGLTLDTIYWGDFHAHTSYSADAAACGAENPVGAFNFARNPAQADLDFVALNDHAEFPNPDAVPAEDADLWHSVLRISGEFNNEDPSKGKVFIVFPGWEYTNTKGMSVCTDSAGYGHKNVVFKSLTEVLDDRIGACMMPIGRKADNAEKLWNKLSDYRPPAGSTEPGAFTLIHTPAHIGPDNGTTPTNHITDWNVMDADFTRHVEIISKWGSSEGPQPEAAGCPQADDPLDVETDQTLNANTLRQILYQKWVVAGDARYRLAIIGGTDNHQGHPGSALEDYCDPNMHYLGGLTGIAATALTRDHLWSALSARHTQAGSTEKRIPLLLSITSGDKFLLMGDHLAGDGGSVRVRALSTAGVDRIDIILDGCLTETVTGSRIDHVIPLTPGRHFIYVRARQTEQDRVVQAWSSPVYIGDAAIDNQ
jgi:hypothetical protein